MNGGSAFMQQNAGCRDRDLRFGQPRMPEYLSGRPAYLLFSNLDTGTRNGGQ